MRQDSEGGSAEDRRGDRFLPTTNQISLLYECNDFRIFLTLANLVERAPIKFRQMYQSNDFYRETILINNFSGGV
jgi:hypothetical protein